MRVSWESSPATAGSREPQVAYATESSSATADRAGRLGAAVSFFIFVTFLVLAAALAFLGALTSFLPLLAEAATARTHWTPGEACQKASSCSLARNS